VTISSDIDLRPQLTAIAGPEHVIRTTDGIAPLGARYSVAPASLEEAARVLRVARDAGAVVAPWGGGTQQRVGLPSDGLDIVVRTERLCEVAEWEPADLTACLQAGLTLQALQNRLAERGQQLPIDAPDPERATLGGLVATNTSGPRRWQYGSWRDLIIGMHVALTDGSVIKTGGRVVKNVQGYDLSKLFTGSLGSLCLIGQVNVKLTPLPPARRLLVGCGELGRVLRFLQEISGATLRVSAVDLLDPEAARLCGIGGEEYAGLALIEDRRDILDAQSLVIERLGVESGVSISSVDGAALEPVWRAWIDLGRISDLGLNEALLCVSALPAQVGAAIERIERLRELHPLRGPVWARAGNGLVYARLAADAAAEAEALAAAHAALLADWPQTTLAAGDPAVARAAKPWGADPAGLSVMRALKQRFDPSRTLQPGRYVGGI
jgi:glycolate oxidase FAD binding subunit